MSDIGGFVVDVSASFAVLVVVLLLSLAVETLVDMLAVEALTSLMIDSMIKLLDDFS